MPFIEGQNKEIIIVVGEGDLLVGGGRVMLDQSIFEIWIAPSLDGKNHPVDTKFPECRGKTTTEVGAKVRIQFRTKNDIDLLIRDLKTLQEMMLQ